MLVGYMRVSSDSDRQTTNLQRDALIAGVDSRHLFEDHASGAKDDRLGLSEALAFVRPGDVLVVWKLDHLFETKGCNDLIDIGFLIHDSLQIDLTRRTNQAFLVHSDPEAMHLYPAEPDAAGDLRVRQVDPQHLHLAIPPQPAIAT